MLVIILIFKYVYILGCALNNKTLLKTISWECYSNNHNDYNNQVGL